MDSESETQLCENIGNDIIGELTHIIPNQQKYRKVFKISLKNWKATVLHYRPNDGLATIFMRCVAHQDIHIDPI